MGDESENNKYKLLGFERHKSLAVVMIVSTGKVVKLKLGELLKSEVIDDFSKAEVKEVYRKFYSGGGTITAYEMGDRNERSWMAYVALNLMLFVLYILLMLLPQSLFILSILILLSLLAFLFIL